MNSPNIRLLHVEDDGIHQALFAHYLAMPNTFQFEISHAVSEDQAVDMFSHGNFDLVILDYNLDQGDGLNCLRRIRQLDPTIPIIAISCAASPEIAGQLIAAGVDDYLTKQSLNSQLLFQSVQNVLHRAKAFRERFAPLLKSS
jgi:CheY-like chemotaxis protein